MFAPRAWLAEADSGKPRLGDCKDAALSRFPIRQNCVCSELSRRNASVLIIAPLSCSPPIYKDLLGSPLHLKFSFISTGVTAGPADSWSSFPPAAGKCGRDSLLRPHPWIFPGDVGLLYGLAGAVLELRRMCRVSLQLSWWLCVILGGGMIPVGAMLPAFGVAIQELQRNFVMGDLRALSSSFLPPWPK